MQESETLKFGSSRKRASKACMNCRVRKVRCDVVRNPGRCTNCALDDTECTVIARRAKYRKRSPVIPERPKPMVFRNSFQQQQESKDVAVTDPMSPHYLDQVPLILESPTGHSPESPSTCFENIEDLTTTWCAEKVKQQSIFPDQEQHGLGPYGAPGGAISHQGAAQNTRSHITYSYYPFLTVDMFGLEPDDVYYLESRNCLSVPTPDALDDFIREYFLHVHPGLPLLDESQFWAVYSGDKQPSLDHLTEQDFEKEIQGSQVYSSQTKRNLVQLFISLCELAIPFTSVVQTVYGMGQSAADAIPPMIEHQKQIEESIRFCEISLDAWYDKASIQFPTPAGIISPEKSLVLYTNLMYIYYYSARVALYQYEAFVVSLTSPGASMDNRLHQTRLQLEDATLGITDNLKELVQLKVARFLPVSIVAYAALPLVLHLLDVRLAKVPSQTARKQGRLNIYMETMKGLQNLYDGVDDVWTFIRAAIDSATSGSLDTCCPRADSIPSSALCSKPSAAIQVADDWGKFLLQEPILYFRLSRTIDLSLAVGCYAEDSSLSLLLATARFPSPSLIFVGVKVPAENQTSTISCDEVYRDEKGDTQLKDDCADMFDDIGDLDGYELGAESFQTPEFLDLFELDLENCDEERPSCAQCRRGGRTCPGYVREMKFVDEGPKVRRSRRVAASALEKAPKGVGLHNGDLLQRRKIGTDVKLSQPSTFKAERDQILSLFVSAMFPLGSSTAQISFLGSWLWHLPPRIGSSAVLDHAALSVAWPYFAKLYGDPIALRNAELSYLCAVRSLALALDDAKEQLSSNVLCATVLLGHFENLKTFVNLRGAERCYESAFEYSMFLACRGAIISEALTSGKRAFWDPQVGRRFQTA
ncbi:cutinase transcription factor 1 beta [Fusarium pseudocircinatum]|uniref:Cutinase transcription factor 1 beta n=1 Tax=Fusarium pseudocircinatum TaxID=56676 RepID=A0A8H5UTF3_9HYPO|nr:cutinase transcription factor 1 beta [Fusarium pseudocircinatum]